MKTRWGTSTTGFLECRQTTGRTWNKQGLGTWMKDGELGNSLVDKQLGLSQTKCASNVLEPYL
jgi:hypothetical protein